MSDSVPKSRTLRRKDLTGRAATIYPGWSENAVKKDQKLGLAPIGAPFAEAQASLYDKVTRLRAALASGETAERLRASPERSPGSGSSGAFPKRSPSWASVANPGSRRQMLCSVVITRALWDGPEVVSIEQARRALQTWATSDSTMSKRRASELFGAVVDQALQLTASDGTRETRALRAQWVRLAPRLGSPDDREPTTLGEILESIEGLTLPKEIARRLVDPAYWPEAPLAVAGQLMPERTVERASKAHALLMSFYLAGLEELREPTPSAFAERFDLVREGLGVIRSELGSVLGDGAIEQLPPGRAPEWVLVVVAIFGLLRLAEIP